MIRGMVVGSLHHAPKMRRYFAGQEKTELLRKPGGPVLCARHVCCCGSIAKKKHHRYWKISVDLQVFTNSARKENTRCFIFLSIYPSKRFYAADPSWRAGRKLDTFIASQRKLPLRCSGTQVIPWWTISIQVPLWSFRNMAGRIA